jgi:acetylornithine/succinyldiaminopimelate/putrescine aminotransferase
MLTNRQLFFQHIAQTSDAPLALEIEKAKGVYLFDTSGKKYLDLISGITVSNLGHSHPKVIEAIKQQLDQYMHLMVYGEYIQSPQVKLAKLLTEQLPSNLNSVFFVNSGSEAVEGALKLSRKYSGRREMISCRNAYHGCTFGAMSVMGTDVYKQAFGPLLPDVTWIDFNNPDQLNQITPKTACVIIEPIQAESGVKLPDGKYLKLLRERCNRMGSMLIFDEVQTGYGRTGKLFAFEYYDVIPDILVLAKGLGGGLPLGAFISSREIMSVLSHNPSLGHITTFGGNPVSCSASLSTLQILLEEKYIQKTEPKAILFKELLKHPKIRDVRGKGLFLSIELDNFEQVKKVLAKCIENGVIADWFLFATNCIRIAPPLIITEDEIRQSCKVIVEAIDSI